MVECLNVYLIRRVLLVFIFIFTPFSYLILFLLVLVVLVLTAPLPVQTLKMLTVGDTQTRATGAKT